MLNVCGSPFGKMGIKAFCPTAIGLCTACGKSVCRIVRWSRFWFICFILISQSFCAVRYFGWTNFLCYAIFLALLFIILFAILFLMIKWNSHGKLCTFRTSPTAQSLIHSLCTPYFYAKTTICCFKFHRYFTRHYCPLSQ